MSYQVPSVNLTLILMRVPTHTEAIERAVIMSHTYQQSCVIEYIDWAYARSWCFKNLENNCKSPSGGLYKTLKCPAVQGTNTRWRRTIRVIGIPGPRCRCGEDKYSGSTARRRHGDSAAVVNLSDNLVTHISPPLTIPPTHLVVRILNFSYKYLVFYELLW